MNDDEVLSEAIRRGRWERFTGADGDDQLTLHLGSFRILTIHHRLLVPEERGVLEILRRGLASEDTLAACLVALARSETMLNEAVKLLSEYGIEHDIVPNTESVGDAIPQQPEGVEGDAESQVGG